MKDKEGFGAEYFLSLNPRLCLSLSTVEDAKLGFDRPTKSDSKRYWKQQQTNHGPIL